MSSLHQKSISRDHAIMLAVTFLGLIGIFYYCGFPLLIPLLVFFFGVHLFYFKKPQPKIFLHLAVLISTLILGTYLVRIYTHLNPFYMPVASMAMLTMLLFNDVQISFMMALMGAMVVGIIQEFSLSSMVIFFLGGLVGVYKVRDARTRGVLWEAGIFVAIIQIICAVMINPVLNNQTLNFIVKPLAFSGLFCSIIVIATLKLFEMLFGEITNFTLLELSDSSQPLIKRMVTEAPGSYHHSLIVSNLAEAAADAIDANSLLTRVGAYYHDIGKLEHPEYFTENQMVIGNKHDVLEPSMSRLVIFNHVKEGIELAQKFRLNQRIIDFIPEHHGTSVMHYFYQKALAEAGPEGLDEREYRYPGPKPQSKETAIVLLADSVEGATRALEEHTPQRVEDVVRKVINNKFIDGQLDECNLSLREIDTIATVFIRCLSAMYHGRVKYPVPHAGHSQKLEKYNGNNTKKSSKEDSHSPSTDNQNNASGV